MPSYLSKGDRQHLVSLLAAHIRLFPQDESAYGWLPSRKIKQKAIALAHSSEAGVRSQ